MINFDFSCYKVLRTDSDVVALLDVNIIQQHLSTVTFPEALLCFLYTSHDSSFVDAWLFFHACLCVFISDGFGVQTLCLNDEFEVFNSPEGAGWPHLFVFGGRCIHSVCQLLGTLSFSLGTQS